MNTPKKAVVIPAYNVAGSIKSVVSSIPDAIDHIIVVDDKCPQSSGKEAGKLNRQNLTVLFHEQNRGVGGAVITGYRKALELGCDIVVKMDGDDQMDSAHLKALIAPLLSGEADYAKGNRFRDFEALKSMPKIRLFGNSVLSFFAKLASGYWNIMDPTNGFTAIHRRAIEELELDKVAQQFFFEIDMLINLGIMNAVVVDVPIPARYNLAQSSLRIWRVLLSFPLKLLKGFVKRIILRYFVYDFNMASVYLLVGLPTFLFGVLYGAWKWALSLMYDRPTPAGTIMLAALPIIVSFQMLLQAVNIDISSAPRRRDRPSSS